MTLSLKNLSIHPQLHTCQGLISFNYCVSLSFSNFLWKNLIGFLQIFSQQQQKPFHFLLWCATLLESNRIYPFLILSCCVFFILRKMEQAVDNINLLDLSSLFWWVKRELWEFLYLSFAYSAKIMDHLFWRGWLPLFKSGWGKESRRFTSVIHWDIGDSIDTRSV